jgi:hypothetical protein
MKPGDLCLFELMNTREKVLGIWISMRYTKWSDKLPFHTILTDKGLKGVFLAQEKVEVINEAR